MVHRLSHIFARRLRSCPGFQQSDPSRKLSKNRWPEMVHLINADCNQIHPSCVAYFLFSQIEELEKSEKKEESETKEESKESKESERKRRMDPQMVKVGASGDGDLGFVDRTYPRLVPSNYEETELTASSQSNFSRLELVLNQYIEKSGIALRQSSIFGERQTAYEKLFWLICLIEFVECLRQIQHGHNATSGKDSTVPRKNSINCSSERSIGYFNIHQRDTIQNNKNNNLKALRNYWLTFR